MKVCPECKYERTQQDDLHFPEYECPSCGIIDKNKAKFEFDKLEEERQKKRRAKLEKIKKEKEKQQKIEEERRRREEEERRQKEEEERVRKLEAEKMRRQEEERRQKEEEERREKEEAERVRKLEAEKLRRQEKERLRKKTEEKLRLEEEEKKRQEEKLRILSEQRQEKISQLGLQNPDRIISAAETDKTYQLFDMCPFGPAPGSKGLAIVGFGETKNRHQRERCMQKYCRLWTLKIDEKGEVYAQGCSLQFLGLNKEEIEKNFFIKNRQILEEDYSLHNGEDSPENRGE